MRNFCDTFNKYRAVLYPVLLVALCGILYFPHLDSVPFYDKGEPREALAVQDIVQRGEWLVPLKRATDVPSKPPVFHWSAALVTRLTGSFTPATIRFPSALYASLGVLLVYWLGLAIYDRTIAFSGAAILATTMVYQSQAVNARVDMTLCFFVTLNLVLFYLLYHGRLKHPCWYYCFYASLGIGTLAKGPLGLALPILVAGSYVAVERRWDVFKKFIFHPGIVLALMLPTTWYAIAVLRAGDGFFSRQIVQENLSRFIGGSGHTHPFYYYVPYMIAEGLPWGLFLPLSLWDMGKNFGKGGNSLFLKLWCLTIFGFLSISAGKRPVYLLPIYPALSLLLAAWFRSAATPGNRRIIFYRAISVFAAIIGLMLLVVSFDAIGKSEGGGWFFSLIEGALKPKDRANLIAVREQWQSFDSKIVFLVALSAGFLWLWLARSAWRGQTRPIALALLLIGIFHSTVAWSVLIPVIAQQKSYREFMTEVNQRIGHDEKLYLYGRFNSDSVVFYRGADIESLLEASDALAGRIGKGNAYVIMPERSFVELQKAKESPLTPLLRSHGSGPEGDAPLVLIQADFP
jgi:4-amino-4-deoxy-L-arabinose transferase-like glycosyltransferase